MKTNKLVLDIFSWFNNLWLSHCSHAHFLRQATFKLVDYTKGQ